MSFEDADYATVCALARDRDVSVAWMVRQAVHGLIEQEKARGADLQLPLIPRMARQAAGTT